MQETKKHVAQLSDNLKDLDIRIQKIEKANYDLSTELDNLQQYTRRDCVEALGIPAVPTDNPKRIAVEIGNLLDLSIKEEDISIAHCLPPTKHVMNRLIIKFVQHDIKEEFYKRRNRFTGKTTKDLPLIADEFGKTINMAEKIYINLMNL
jgi:hypothetical protein